MIFGIAGAVLFVNMLVNKCLLAYFCREPPNFNENLPENVLAKLSYLPLVMLFVSFWQLGNVEIFENRVGQQHSLWKQVAETKFTSPYFLPAFLLVVYGQVRLYQLCRKVILYFIEKENANNEVLEDLVPFYSSLTANDRQVRVQTEKHFSHYYKLNTSKQETIDRIVKAEKEEVPLDKLLSGIPSYKLLDNPDYMQQLNYFPITQPVNAAVPFVDLKRERKQSDVVYLCVNYMYLPDAVRAGFTLTDESIFPTDQLPISAAELELMRL